MVFNKPQVSKLSWSFYLVAVVWIYLVTTSYFNPEIHPIFGQILPNLPKFLFIPTLLISIITGWLFAKRAFIKEKVRLSVYPWEVLLLFWGIAIVGLVTAALEKNAIGISDLGSGLVSLIGKILVTTFWLLVFTFIVYVAGRRVIQWLGLRKIGTLTRFVMSIALGFMVYNFGLFFLSMGGQLKTAGILLLLILMAVLGYSYWYSVFKMFKNKVVIETRIASPSFWFGLIIFLFLILNASILFEPFPSGWDSLTSYFNLAKEVADTGSLLRGQYAYPVEMGYGSVMVLSRFVGLGEYAEMLAVFLGGWGGFMGMLAVVVLGRYIGGWKVGVTSALLYYTSPMVTYFNSWEPKSEATLGLFLTLTLLAYWRWRKSLTNRWLLVAGIFFGFSVLIKFTAALMSMPLALVFLYDLLCGKGKDHKLLVLKQLGISAAVGLCVMVPWLGYHTWEHGWRLDRPMNLFLGTDPVISRNVNSVARLWVKKVDYDAIVTGYIEDYGRYVGEEKGWWGLEKYLPAQLASIPMARYTTLPWDAVMSSNRRNTNMLIGSLFLTFLPLFAWMRVFNKPVFERFKIPRSTRLLVIFTIVYLLVWTVTSWGVVWYGWGMLISLSLLMALLFIKSWSFLIARIGILALLFLNIGLNISLHMNRYGHPVFLRFDFGKMTKAQAVETLMPSVQNMGKIINEDPQIQSGEKIALRISGYFPYFVNNSRHVLLDDVALDFFSVLDAAGNHDDKAMLESLKAANIKYIIADVSIFYNDMTSDKTLQDKVLRFMEFASTNLLLLDAHEKGGVGTLLLEVQ